MGYAIGLRRDRGVPPPVDPPVGFGLVLVGVFGFLLPFWLFDFLGFYPIVSVRTVLL